MYVVKLELKLLVRCKCVIELNAKWQNQKPVNEKLDLDDKCYVEYIIIIPPDYYELVNPRGFQRRCLKLQDE